MGNSRLHPWPGTGTTDMGFVLSCHSRWPLVLTVGQLVDGNFLALIRPKNPLDALARLTALGSSLSLTADTRMPWPDDGL